MTTAPDAISVIIPAWADTPSLRRAMWSVQVTADREYELIVTPAKQCVAKNRNAGLRRARHDLIAFLDDDVLLPARWMSRLATVLQQHQDVGAVSAYLTYPDGRPQMSRPKWDSGELWDILPAGTCFLYSRERVRDTRFDETYLGSQWEDTDWMRSVRELGLRTVVCADVHVAHDHAMREGQWTRHNGTHYLQKWGDLPPPEETSAIDLTELANWRPPPLESPGTADRVLLPPPPCARPQPASPLESGDPVP